MSLWHPSNDLVICVYLRVITLQFGGHGTYLRRVEELSTKRKTQAANLESKTRMTMLVAQPHSDFGFTLLAMNTPLFKIFHLSRDPMPPLICKQK